MYLNFCCTCEKRVTGKQPLGTILAVYRIRTTKVSLRRPYLITCAENQQSNLENQQSALFFNVRFCLKKLPVRHVRQATIFAGQTVKFYRSATGDRYLFRGLVCSKLVNKLWQCCSYNLLTRCVCNRFVASLLTSCDNAVPTTCQQDVFAIGL